MPKLFVFLGVVLMLGCHEPKRNYPIPSESDINEIVKAIVAKDSLFNRAVPLYIKLRKIKTIKTIDNIPPPFGDLSIGVLTHSAEYGFNAEDAEYLLFQNDTLKRVTLDTAILKNVVWIDSIGIKKKKRPNWSHYQISIPIFSVNQKKALVELDRDCPSCGEGFKMMVEKINGKWSITWFKTSWIN